MPTTLTLAVMASLLLLAHALKRLKAPSHTFNHVRTADRAFPVFGAARAQGA